MRLIILCLILSTSGFNLALAEKRIALVIGNSDYETTGWDLENPVNDAALVSGALETVSSFRQMDHMDRDRPLSRDRRARCLPDIIPRRGPRKIIYFVRNKVPGKPFPVSGRFSGPYLVRPDDRDLIVRLEDF